MCMAASMGLHQVGAAEIVWDGGRRHRSVVVLSCAHVWALGVCGSDAMLGAGVFQGIRGKTLSVGQPWMG